MPLTRWLHNPLYKPKQPELCHCSNRNHISSKLTSPPAITSPPLPHLHAYEWLGQYHHRSSPKLREFPHNPPFIQLTNPNWKTIPFHHCRTGGVKRKTWSLLPQMAEKSPRRGSLETSKSNGWNNIVPTGMLPGLRYDTSQVFLVFSRDSWGF